MKIRFEFIFILFFITTNNFIKDKTTTTKFLLPYKGIPVIVKHSIAVILLNELDFSIRAST